MAASSVSRAGSSSLAIEKYFSPPMLVPKYLLLEELPLPLGRVLPARVQQNLVGQDDERIARLLVERVDPGILPRFAGLLREDLVEPLGDVPQLDAHPLADPATERRQEEEEPRRDSEELGRVVARLIHGRPPGLRMM